jgi:hypothetical protein
MSFGWRLPLLAGLPLLAALLSMPASRAADEPDPEPPGTWPRTRPGDRNQSATNLKMIALALHNYHDAMGALPAVAAFRDKAGKPLLSWRVALLPYLEEEKLYREFKLDEPWDSKHNKKLLARIPKVFAPPIVGKPPKAGTTYYQFFTGPNTPFNAKAIQGPRIPASFPDGTSNTILVAEAGEAVPWTKPIDLVCTAKKPVPKLGGLFPEGFHIALADGSTRFIGRRVAQKDLRLLIDPADGQVIRWERIPVAQPPQPKK